MAITFQDLLKLPFFDSLAVVAGSKGLEKPISSTGIVDYEYARDYVMEKPVFIKDSLVVSSLLFAKDDPDSLQDAINELIRLEVSGLAYKTAFYQDLPANILEIAEKHRFPILKFGMEIYIEEFIFHVMENVRLENRLTERELLVGKLIHDQIKKEDLPKVARELNSRLRDNIMAAYMRFPGSIDFIGMEKIIRNLKATPAYEDKITVCTYEEGLFVLHSGNHSDKKKFVSLFNDVLAYQGIDEKSCIIGRSTVRPCPEHLDQVLQQAYYAGTAARLENTGLLDFEEIGDYQILIPHRQSRHLIQYMNSYLAPILAQDPEATQETLKTAVQYVITNGDLVRTAEKLYCHKNTVRYRINKLHEKLDPNHDESVFFEHLALAIRIYLLTQDQQPEAIGKG